MNRLRAREIGLEAAKLIVIESIETQTCRTGSRGFVYGSLEPFAIVTCSPNGTRAIDMEANPISLAELTRAVPEIIEMISAPTDD